MKPNSKLNYSSCGWWSDVHLNSYSMKMFPGHLTPQNNLLLESQLVLSSGWNSQVNEAEEFISVLLKQSQKQGEPRSMQHYLGVADNT